MSGGDGADRIFQALLSERGELDTASLAIARHVAVLLADSSADPSTTLADFLRLGIPKSVFL